MLGIKESRMKSSRNSLLPYIETHNPMLELINLYPSQYAYSQPHILYAKYGEIHNLYRGPEIRRNLNRNIGPGIIPPRTVGGGG